MTSVIRHPIVKAARDPSRSTAAPTLSTRPLVLHKASKGFNLPPPQCQPEQSGSCIPQPVALGMSDTGPWPMDLVAGSSTNTAPPTIVKTLVHQRVAADVAKAQPLANPPKKQRKRRTCAKCATSDCSGSQSSAYCKNKCQDCGERNCRGRNSRKPGKLCSSPGLWDN